MTSIMYTESGVPDVPEERDVRSAFAVGSEVYKLRDIQRFCKTKIVPQPIPSLDDVTAIKAEKILDDCSSISVRTATSSA